MCLSLTTHCLQKQNVAYQWVFCSTKIAQTITEYIHNNDCDVVVSLVAPFINLREEFKEKLGDDIVELYTHTTEKRERYRYRVKDYEPPQINFIDIDTTKDSIETSFSKIINNLNKLEKL